jgi:hypothetical protein
MKLEYLIIMEKSGLPIYSRCFGGFCWNLMTDEVLLSGFLTALSSMPTMFGGDELSLKSIEMGNTKINFDHTTPSGHIICLGIDSITANDPEAKQEIQQLFDNITKFLEINHKETDFSMLFPEEREQFHDQLKKEVIEPALIVFEDKDFCRTHGSRDSCPVDTQEVVNNSENHTLPLWESLGGSLRPSTIYEKYFFWIFRPFFKLFAIFLRKKHRNNYYKLKKEKELNA